MVVGEDVGLPRESAWSGRDPADRGELVPAPACNPRHGAYANRPLVDLRAHFYLRDLRS